MLGSFLSFLREVLCLRRGGGGALGGPAEAEIRSWWRCVIFLSWRSSALRWTVWIWRIAARGFRSGSSVCVLVLCGGMAPAMEYRNGGSGGVEGAEGRRFSREEVATHRGADGAWIVVDGEVYNVTEFLESHPGGSGVFMYISDERVLMTDIVRNVGASEVKGVRCVFTDCTIAAVFNRFLKAIILEHLQEKDLGQLMRGVSNTSDHAHSETAFGMLKDYHIGSLNDMPCAVSTAMHQAKRVDDKSKIYTVDLNKPLVFQVGHLGDGYQEWVHQPIVQKESPRFFANDFMESLTKTLWWVVPVIWIPVVCWCQVIAIRRGFPVDKLLTTMPLGIFIWSLVEYSLHRFLFHVKTTSYWANTLHYLLHGCHHKHPMDGYRLVFPPTFAAMFAVPLYGVLALLFSRIWTPSVFGFGLLGYVVYDVTHYFLHHGTPVNDATRNLKRYHLNHHFKMQEDGYGITSPFWDFIFGTLPAKLKYDSNLLQ